MGAAASTTSGNNVIAVVAAIYTIVLCIIQICIGTAAGLVSGGLNQLTTAVTEAGGTVSSEVGQITGATGVLAILLIAVGAAMLFAAVGVFMRRRWSWMLMIGSHAAYVVLAILSGGLSTVVGIIFIALSAGVVATFFLIADIKRALNVA